MTRDTEQLLRIFAAGINASSPNFDATEIVDWQSVLTYSLEQRLATISYTALKNRADVPEIVELKKAALIDIQFQIRKNVYTKSLMKLLNSTKIQILFLKGIILSQLYPEPEFRFSGDCDLLVPEESLGELCQLLISNGFHVASKEENVIGLIKDRFFHVELHTSLFTTDQMDFRYKYTIQLEGCYKRKALVTLPGFGDVPTLSPDDHLFYLICHTAKHFILRGCGVKALIDIALFISSNHSILDIDLFVTRLQNTSLLTFTATFLSLIIDFFIEEIGVSELWERLAPFSADYSSLADELLQSGDLGHRRDGREFLAQSSKSAVNAATLGKSSARFSLRTTLFPPRSELPDHFAYAKKNKYLLPIAWVHRIITFTFRSNRKNAGKLIQLGNKRITILRQYGLLNSIGGNKHES